MLDNAWQLYHYCSMSNFLAVAAGLALCCLVADIFTGTAFWQTNEGHDMFADDHFDVFGTDSHDDDGGTSDYWDAYADTFTAISIGDDLLILTDAELDDLTDDVDVWRDDDELDQELVYSGLLFDVPADGGPWADVWTDEAPF